MPQLKRIVAHRTFAEHLLIPGAGLLRLREVIAEISPDEFLARAAGRCFGRGVDIRDLPVRPDGHQRIDAGFQQAAVVDVGQSQRIFSPLALADVASDRRSAHHSAGNVPDWREGE